MGAVFDPAVYSPSWLSVPYIVLLSLQLGLLGYLLFTRGSPLLRMPLIALMVPAVVFAAAQAAAASCTDAAVANRLYKLMIGPLSLIGPAFFALLQAEHDRLYRYRLLLAAAITASIATAALTFTSDLVVAGVWVTSWGMYYGHAGPLLEVHLANLVGWVVVGAVIAARGARGGGAASRRRQMVRAVVSAVLIALANTDVLLAHHIGVYPLSWVPAIGSITFTLVTIPRIDLIRTRGRDWATAWEVALVALLGVAVYVTARYAPPGVTIAVVAPLLVGAQAGAGALRRRFGREHVRAGRELEREIEAYAHRAAAVRDPGELEAGARAILEGRLGLADVRLLSGGDERLSRALDARVRAWLEANRGPLLAERMSAQRLGGLRGPIEGLLAALPAAVVLPLVDRDELVGLLVAGERADGRSLLDAEVAALARVQDATARAITWIALYRDAEQRVEVAREVEIAAAVQHARSPGASAMRIGDALVAAHYLPAGQFGGDWWSAAELADGRVLVLLGDVTGHGVPAALVTAAVEGCCETAQRLLGAGFEVFGLMHLLNRTVLDVGRSQYLMSCFAAVVDPASRSVTFANAGHPFPYVARRSGLRAMVSRGMPLGVEAEPLIAVARMDLEPDDVVVMFTDALVESDNAEGARYGDRRLQRALRRLASKDAVSTCRAIVDDAQRHYGGRAIREDITLLCLSLAARPGGAP